MKHLMKYRQKKAVVSTLLAFVLLLCTTFSVNAADARIHSVNQLTDADLQISEEVAGFVAEYFIDDMIATGQTAWNDDTSIVNSVITYNITGDDITSYTFELDSGFVTVAAYADMPSMILEWSDKAEPAYSSFDLDSTSKIIYTGPMNYYLDDGGTTFETYDGTTISKSQVSDSVSSLRDVQNLRSQVSNHIYMEKDQLLQKSVRLSDSSSNEPNNESGGASDNTFGGYITDVKKYAYNLYGGSWTSVDWENNWEDDSHFAVTSDFSGYKNHCGPTAITNAIQMYGSKNYVYTGSDQTVFKNVIKANLANNGKYYSGSDGTWNSSAGEFIEKAFLANNIYAATTYGTYDCNIENTKNACTDNRLMYIMLLDHATYGDHHVIGYAWNAMSCPSVSSNPFYFIKICDGHRKYGTYLHLAYLELLGTKYWEIYFA
ncbi:hypothetical protein AALA61_15785 [Oscillospiraceae bacterium 42-9]